MKISIVTISYNQAKYLRQCIESILQQSVCELEYIVVDPGSTDGSRELIESYGDRIVRVFERDNGPADGLNKGFAKATGDIYGFINSDDYLLPQALQHISRFFLQNSRDVFVTGGGYTENESGQRTAVHPSVLSAPAMLNRSAVIFQQTTFFPAEIYKQVQGFNTSNTTCWDYELFLNFLLNGSRHEVLQQDLAVFRLYQGSISGSGRLADQYFKDLDQLFLHHVGRKRGLKDKLLTAYLRLQRKITLGN
jgi:glycosyltransferase involved in cell wall biosynthesis